MAVNAYRIGFPGWKAAAQYFGAPLKFRVYIHKDKESGTYWAESPDLDGLVVSGGTLEEVKDEVLNASGELLKLAFASSGNHRPRAKVDMRNIVDVPCVA